MKQNELFLTTLIEKINLTHKIPKFKAEVVDDVLLSCFIEELLSIHYKTNLTLVAQEFPLKKPSNNQSTNCDYLLVSDDTLYIVELKTYSGSLSLEQLNIYINTALDVTNGGSKFLLDNYEKLLYGSDGKKSSYYNKYHFYLENVIKPSLQNRPPLNSISKCKVLYIAPMAVKDKMVYSVDHSSLVDFISLGELSQIKLKSDLSSSWELISPLFHSLNNN